MPLIGILCNPQSGKDVRRLLTVAATVDDVEKVNTIERIILSASAVNNQRIIIMPERLGYGKLVLSKLCSSSVTQSIISIHNMETKENMSDTQYFASEMEQMNANVLIVMGGDGTSRAAAKGTVTIPTISISTGTNNAYPQMLEGTAVGVCAGVIASGKLDIDKCVWRAKCINIYINGNFADIALIDLVFCTNPFIGSKAINNLEEITQVITTQCSMSSIGFSALIGSILTVKPDENNGAIAKVSIDHPNTLVPIGSGCVESLRIYDVKKIALGEITTLKMDTYGTLAVDGEREICYKPGDIIQYLIKKNGPIRINVSETIDYARDLGIFKL